MKNGPLPVQLSFIVASNVGWLAACYMFGHELQRGCHLMLTGLVEARLGKGNRIQDSQIYTSKEHQYSSWFHESLMYQDRKNWNISGRKLATERLFTENSIPTALPHVTTGTDVLPYWHDECIWQGRESRDCCANLGFWWASLGYATISCINLWSGRGQEHSWNLASLLCRGKRHNVECVSWSRSLPCPTRSICKQLCGNQVDLGKKLPRN